MAASFSSHTMLEDSEEYMGPSLAFLPLRGTEDCAQDDSSCGVSLSRTELQSESRPRENRRTDGEHRGPSHVVTPVGQVLYRNK